MFIYWRPQEVIIFSSNDFIPEMDARTRECIDEKQLSVISKYGFFIFFGSVYHQEIDTYGLECKLTKTWNNSFTVFFRDFGREDEKKVKPLLVVCTKLSPNVLQ